ncbi:MAG: response regulator [Candidatus Sumerlaeia bacterium]|nr:response regulator [Candidatus Sumerlaeia bacterium]
MQPEPPQSSKETQELDPSVIKELVELRTECKRLQEQLKSQHGIYKDLGQRLSAASSDQEVASIILNAAQVIIGWDAAYLGIYDSQTDKLITLAEFDRVDGVIKEFREEYTIKYSPGPLTRKVIQGYSLYGDRENIAPANSPFSHFGTDRQSESLIITPLLDHQKHTFGVITIQSYTKGAYTEKEHGLFRSLADFCADAILRSLAETNLRLNEERLHFALSGTNLGVWDWNLETDAVLFTAQFAELLGYTQAEVDQYQNFWQIITHPEEADRVHQHLEDHLHGTSPLYEMRRRLKRKNGTWGWFEDRGKVVARNRAGKPSRMTGTIADITDEIEDERKRREMEAQLQQAQKMESLGLLAGGIAHDFNNLLVSILGNLEISLGKLSPDNEVTPLLRNAELGAQQAARLTQQILAYAGKSNLRWEYFNFSELVRNMTQLIGVMIPKKIDLKLDLDENLPKVEGDLTQIRQVVMNLLTNAAEAIGNNAGTILICTYQKHKTTPPKNPLFLTSRFEPGPFVCLEVVDSGCGMDSQTLERIFEPFFTTKPTGKGLGLAATIGIIRSHQGFMEIESKPGRGTTFRIFIPVLSEEARQAERREESSSGRFPIVNPKATNLARDGKPPRFEGTLKGRILIIDDESSVRDVASRMLQQHGLETLEAENGKRGLEVWANNRDHIDMLLLDCMMPLMTGFEVYEEVRKIDPVLPILFSSGYNEHDTRQKVVEDHHVGFIQKPYRKATLLNHVKELLTL